MTMAEQLHHPRPEACGALDPRRGVGCNLIEGHAGDHKSVGGFPFARTEVDAGASNADRAAALTMLHEAGIQPDWETGGVPCDDCGRSDGTHDEEVEH